MPPISSVSVPAPPEDARLVERVQLDDETAFRALYVRHARYVAGVIYRLLGNDSELDDIVQETFVDATQGLKSLEDPSSLRRWLVVVAVRKVKTLLARRRRRSFFRWSLGQVTPTHSNPSDGQLIDDLYEALDDLPAKLRIPWVLSRIADQSLPEVALICGVSLATVKRRIVEADERLQRRIDVE
ncbi:MAG TPA: RNA polymerase sigma factor [Polyangiaceae bacterium]